MGKFDEKVEFYAGKMSEMGIKVDNSLLIACAKACGPSLYKADAETVSGSDKDELDRVKKNYLGGKLGLANDAKLDDLMNYALDTIGRSNRNKYRAIFYYLLSKKSGVSPS